MIKLVNRNDTIIEFGSHSDSIPTGRDLVNELQICLEEISKPYPRCDFLLILSNELVTQPVLALLIQLLNQPFTRSSSSTAESSTITGDKTTKWNCVCFSECRLARPDSTALQTQEDKELYCSPDNIQLLGSTMALRTKELQILKCPEIVDALYDAHKLEISTLHIEKWEFSALDCTRFANVLQQRERPLVSLYLATDYIEDPLALAKGLMNVKELSIDPPYRNSTCAKPSYPSLGNSLVGEGATGMLLQSPRSQLKALRLEGLKLDDCHFMAFVDILPASQLEDLYLSSSNISCDGIRAFAHQLPRITCLKKIRMHTRGNSSEEHCLNGHHQECCLALTQGMRYNYSIEFLQLDAEVLNYESYVEDLAYYYTDLNHNGRRILVTSKPVPAGLWPRILERVGTMQFRYYDRESPESWRANSIYDLLQNSSLVCCPLRTTG